MTLSKEFLYCYCKGHFKYYRPLPTLYVISTYSHKNLKEATGNTSLLIIAKTKMYGGHCYLGLNLEDEIIYRPIYKEEPGTYESNLILFFVVFREKIILTLKYFFCCMVELKNQKL